MRAALVGPDGTLGKSLKTALKSRGIEITEFRRGMIGQSEPVFELAETLSRFDFIINAAAYTNVDLAEKRHHECFDSNVTLPGKLSRASEISGVKLVQVSSDFVFNGEAKRPYKVDDRPDPKNVYGRTKYQGELEVLRSPNGYVVRTSWLMKDFQTGFLGKLAKLARDKEEITVVDDQFGSPTHVDDLSEYILNMCIDTYGQRIFHGVSKGHASRYELAAMALGILGYRGQVTAVKTVESDDVAIRPKFAVLQPTDLASFSIGDWREALKKVENIS